MSSCLFFFAGLGDLTWCCAVVSERRKTATRKSVEQSKREREPPRVCEERKIYLAITTAMCPCLSARVCACSLSTCFQFVLFHPEPHSFGGFQPSLLSTPFGSQNRKMKSDIFNRTIELSLDIFWLVDLDLLRIMPVYTVNRAPFLVPAQYEVRAAEGFAAFGDCVRVRLAQGSLPPPLPSGGGTNAALAATAAGSHGTVNSNNLTAAAGTAAPGRRAGGGAGGGGGLSAGAASANALNATVTNTTSNMFESTSSGSHFVAPAPVRHDFIIRKFAGIAQHPSDLLVLLRIAQLQQCLGSLQGVLPIVDMYSNSHLSSLRDVYAVYPLMECTLADAINSTTPLQTDQVLTIVRELTSSLRQLHANDIILGELRPEWIGINTRLSGKGCVAIQNLSYVHAAGEPLANVPTFDDPDNAHKESPLLWYRAPEFVLRGNEGLTAAADMWSLGCVIAEMIMRRPLFHCDTFMQSLDMVSDVLGVPENPATFFSNPHALRLLRELPPKSGIPLTTALPGVERRISFLLSRLLVWDPTKRITAEELLAHSYLNGTSATVKLPPVVTIPKTWRSLTKQTSLSDLLVALDGVATNL